MRVRPVLRGLGPAILVLALAAGTCDDGSRSATPGTSSDRTPYVPNSRRADPADREPFRIHAEAPEPPRRAPMARTAVPGAKPEGSGEGSSRGRGVSAETPPAAPSLVPGESSRGNAARRAARSTRGAPRRAAVQRRGASARRTVAGSRPVVGGVHRTAPSGVRGYHGRRPPGVVLRELHRARVQKWRAERRKHRVERGPAARPGREAHLRGSSAPLWPYSTREPPFFRRPLFPFGVPGGYGSAFPGSYGGVPGLFGGPFAGFGSHGGFGLPYGGIPGSGFGFGRDLPYGGFPGHGFGAPFGGYGSGYPGYRGPRRGFPGRRYGRGHHHHPHGHGFRRHRKRCFVGVGAGDTRSSVFELIRDPTCR